MQYKFVILLLAVPIVIAGRSGRWVWGVALSGALAVAAATLPPAMIAAQLARLTPPVQAMVPDAALAAGRPGSLEIVRQSGSEAMIGALDCGSLCERLLTGGQIEWIRATQQSFGDDVPPPPMIYRRATGEDCSAVDPRLTGDAMCILASIDTEREADLSLSITVTGDGHVRREEVGFAPILTDVATATLTDERPRIVPTLFQASDYGWIAPVGWLPLRPNSGFDGNGLHGGGLAPAQKRGRSEPVDLAQALSVGGLRLAPERDSEPIPNPLWSQKGHTQPAQRPYDAALVVSLVEAVPAGKLTEPQSALITAWVNRFVEGRNADATDRAILRRLYTTETLWFRSIKRLAVEHPEYFVDDFADFYAQVLTGTDDEAERAAHIILSRVRSDPPGTHHAESEAFLAAFRSGRADLRLVQVIGKYDFDPAPLLAARYARRADGTVPDDGYFLYQAACNSDRRWAGSLGPLVYAEALPLLPVPGDRDLDDRLSDAFGALRALGRDDLAERLAAELDPAFLGTMASYRNLDDVEAIRRQISQAGQTPPRC